MPPIQNTVVRSQESGDLYRSQELNCPWKEEGLGDGFQNGLLGKTDRDRAAWGKAP